MHNITKLRIYKNPHLIKSVMIKQQSVD